MVTILCRLYGAQMEQSPISREAMLVIKAMVALNQSARQEDIKKRYLSIYITKDNNNNNNNNVYLYCAYS